MASSNKEFGKYFVIEGNDGTGKSTQAELLGQYLQNQLGIETFVTHEPGGVPIADALREIIKNGELERDADTNILMFTAARHEIWKRARQSLQLGHYVISARNYYSTIAYQAIAERTGSFLQAMEKADEIVALTRQYTDDLYMTPDGLVVLQMPTFTRRLNIGSRGRVDTPDTFESRGDEFQHRVDDGYDYVAEKFNAVRIDTVGRDNRQKTIEEVHIEIRKAFGFDAK
ncbi:dTMP kinase [Candidatus Saccharibacteria bacterium]|nr:MAG: dTMP kinase [Candidatus Saccharibacteria bacterium]